MGRSETLQDNFTGTLMDTQGLKHLITSALFDFLSFVCESHVIRLVQYVFFINLLMHTGVKRARSRRGRAVERKQSGSEPRWQQSGSPLSHPGQRAGSGRETWLWFLWGGEEGRVAHAHGESGKSFSLQDLIRSDLFCKC